MYPIYLLCTLLPFLTLSTVLANPLGVQNPPIPARVCGTQDPSVGLRAAHGWLQVAEREVENGARTANLTGVIGKRGVVSYNPSIVVDTYFHIVSTAANQNVVTDQMIRNQVLHHRPLHPSQRPLLPN
jgi:hypothetical protein